MLEVLAPVGNIQALKAAIYSGADAVYLGLDMFNARMKAGNFTKENIRQYVEYCHLFGVKVYVAFNTQIKNSEFDIFAEYVDVAAKAKVDAFIVTDLGALEVFRKYDVPLHASTQIGVHNLAGAKVIQALGFTRVVLARETLIEDIIKIKNGTSLEIEYFVHGALCVSFSGACLMSSMMSGDSGNRGRCNQPCRLKYSSTFAKDEKYLLSPKDQCLIDRIEQLRDAGVDSLKIEGRLKQPHYVGEVVGQYRKAVDNLLFKKDGKIDRSALKRAYNRGNFTQGYNFESSKDIIFDKINGNIGEEVGSVAGYENGTLKLKLKSPLYVGDGVKIIKNGRELGGFSVTNIKKVKDVYYINIDKKFETGSSVCLTLEKSQVDKYENISPKLSIKFALTAVAGERLSLKGRHGDIEVVVCGEIVEPAVSRGIDREAAQKQLLRLGDSEFTATAEDIDFVTDEKFPCFVPLSSLNNIRRAAVEKLKQRIVEEFENKLKRTAFDREIYPYLDRKIPAIKDSLFVEIDGGAESLDALKRLTSKIVLCLHYSDKLSKNLKIILENDLIKNNLEYIFLKLPRVARGKDYNVIEHDLKECVNMFDGIIADNLYCVYLAKELNKALIGGIGLNIYNDRYGKIVGLDGAINSVELNKNELISGGIIYGFGWLPIMTLLHCPIQVNTGCDCAGCRYKGEFSYYDKRGEYKIRRTKIRYCQFELYNQQDIDVSKKISSLSGSFYLNLSDRSAKEINGIIDGFVKKSCVCVDNSTCGHLFRGVK